MALFYKLSNFISDTWWNFRKRCQRFQRGYAWGDIWDMDVWFIFTVKPMLKHLLNTHQGCPCGVDNKEWELVLQEMIDCLTLMDEDKVQEYLNIADNDYSAESRNRIDELMDEKKNRFFELFSKWFFYLWD